MNIVSFKRDVCVCGGEANWGSRKKILKIIDKKVNFNILLAKSRDYICHFNFVLLPSPSSYCLLHDRPINRETSFWGKEWQLCLENQ